ncbi:WEB family [Sesbania bispinosa]|nr:WEB family [Sesbania bispinosa]
MVGEIDTKSIEPVRNAVSLFGDKGDQKKNQPTRNKLDCEKEVEELTKELASCKVQLEAKHAAHMQALLKQEQNQKMIHELSTLLKKSDIERNKYMNECSEGRSYKHELESKMKEISDLNMEMSKIRDQLSHVLTELKATQRELLKKDTEIVAARDSELKALTKAEHLETALKIEKEQKEELLQQVKELNEVIHRSKLDAIQAERENFAMLSEKDEKIELATKATAQVQQELEEMRKHVEMLQGLQSQQMDKSTQVDLELKERKIMDQSVYIEKLEMKLNEFKQELKSAKEEINGLNMYMTNESLTSELEKAKEELNMNKEKDIEAQVEIALLKSQIQEYRLAYKNGYVIDEHSKAEAEERNSENKYNNDHITMSLKDYTYLVREAEKASEVGSQRELSLMKKEVENASVKIAELRARAEQALSRAELAENAKAALEDKIRRHREHRQRRKAALTALREESTPKPFSPSSSHGTPGTYQPLGKVLNMKL